MFIQCCSAILALVVIFGNPLITVPTGKNREPLISAAFHPPFFPSSLLQQLLRILNFLLLLRKHVVNMSFLLGLQGFLSVVHTHVYVNKRVTKEILGGPFKHLPSRVDEWHERWKKMGQLLKDSTLRGRRGKQSNRQQGHSNCS